MLDVGCGQGYFLNSIKNAKSRTGVDVSSAAIRILQQNCIDGYECFLPDLNLGDKRFDIITCFETLEHVVRWKDTIKNMIKYLRDRGYLIISVPFENSIVIDEHVVYFDMDRLCNFLKKFVSILEIKILGPWVIVIATKEKRKLDEVHSYFKVNK